MTAVLPAEELEAEQCELIKDVSGYFSSDPNSDRTLDHLPSLSHAQAVAMADAACDLLQRQAIECAKAAGFRLVVRSLGDAAPRTVIPSADGSHNGHRGARPSQ